MSARLREQMEKRVAAIKSRMEGYQRQLTWLISVKAKAEKIRDALVEFKNDFEKHEQGLQDRKEVGDPQVRGEVQSWTLVRGGYLYTINKAAEYLDECFPEGLELRVATVKARSFKFGEPRQSRSGSRRDPPETATAETPEVVLIELDQPIVQTAVRQSAVTTRLVELDQPIMQTAVQQSAVTTSLARLGQHTTSSVGEVGIEELEAVVQSDGRERGPAESGPGETNENFNEPEVSEEGSTRASAISVPSQYSKTPLPRSKERPKTDRGQEPWKSTRIFGTSISGVSSKTVEWVLDACPREAKSLVAYLEKKADELDEASNRVRARPIARAVRRLRNATEAARAIMDRADEARRANLPDDILVAPMDELNVAIEEAETVLMPYIQADGHLIDSEIAVGSEVKAATRAEKVDQATTSKEQG
jgi:hypothetical protein